MVASIKHNVSHIQHCHDSIDTLKNGNKYDNQPIVLIVFM